jgi:hypothetical protein
VSPQKKRRRRRRNKERKKNKEKETNLENRRFWAVYICGAS